MPEQDVLLLSRGTLPGARPHPGSTSAPAPLVPLEEVAAPETLYARFGKPTLDFVGALLALLILLPVMVTTALMVAIAHGRPILYSQERIGRDGTRFKVYKFRSMLADRRSWENEDAWGGVDRRRSHKHPEDPRHTRLGRHLRAWSLDELPQLWNVLRGEMSLVGPRPELPWVVERHYDRWQHARHQVKPGVTGLWQVSARSEGDMHEHTHIDLEYVTRVSLLTDLGILLRTPLAAFGMHKGA